ncbi:MAG: hypothetical protein JXO72_11430 [Vicinamibacteria bacterium]|nr:hypothetical protein [Vicinamibacteria bacterium]
MNGYRRTRDGRFNLLRRIQGTLLAAGLWLLPVSTVEAREDWLDFTKRIESSWNARNLDAYLALWEFADEEAADRERSAVEQHIAGDETKLEIHAPRFDPSDEASLVAQAEIFSIREPRARAEQCLFRLKRRPGGWAIEERETLNQVEGLVHLGLDSTGRRADGLELKLEDFELRMHRGTLFSASPGIGLTAFVFVGEGRVRFTPRPQSEQEQLRQFCGRRTLDVRVRRVFVRLHPADFTRIVTRNRLDPDPLASQRLREARKAFSDWASQVYLLDASLPRSPWWTMPSAGEVVVKFDSRHGDLTFAATNQPEGLMLFHNKKRLQICLYPAAGKPVHYSDDRHADVDILHHDLHVSYDPKDDLFEAKDVLRLKPLSGASSVRFKLDSALNVHSITSREWGQHLFFRVRNQNALIVSLGSLVHQRDEFKLTIHYSGRLAPNQPQEDAQLHLSDDGMEREIAASVPKTYANRPYWYPQADFGDYATATVVFDVPREHLAVTGGERTRFETVGRRTIVEYRQDQPCRYITATFGRLQDAGALQDEALTLSGFGTAVTRGELRSVLSKSRDILRYYETLFGPCPYQHLNIILIEGTTPGGHSPPGMTIVSRRSMRLTRAMRSDPADFSDVPDFFLAHELAHQWWGHGVAPENYRERWLSEAFAHYAAALWVRHASGERDFTRIVERMAKWAIRSTDQGPIHLGYRLGHVKRDPRIYRAVVYDKGACVLNMLAGIIGKGPFFEALRELQRSNRFQKIGTDDLQRALESKAQLDLDAYFTAWVYDTPLPRLRPLLSRSHENSQYLTKVRVETQNLPGPVPLAVSLKFAHGPSLRHKENLDPSGSAWLYRTEERPRQIELNDDQGLLAIIKR